MKGLWAAALLMACATAANAQDGTGGDRSGTGASVVTITSPLGRTSESATVRIVARVERPVDASAGPLRLRFYVDGVKVGAVETPPYAVTWTDENPFEPREIKVEAEDESGVIGRDSVILPAFEIN